MTTLCYCIALRKASRKVSSLYDDALAEFDITVAQFSLMRRLQKGQPLSVTDLAERLDLDRSTVGRNVKLMERKGLILTETGEDLREARLRLSKTGEDLLQRSDPKWCQVQVDVETKLGTHGVQQLTALLNAL